MNRMHPADQTSPSVYDLLRISLLLPISLLLTWTAGCSHRRANTPRFDSTNCGVPCQSLLQQLEYADIKDNYCDDDSDILAAAPLTISTFQEQQSWELTIEQCVEYALANSDVLQKLGGVVVNSPVAARTLYDQAINETNPGSVEAALSAFDAQLNTGLFFNRGERRFNNPLFGGGASSQVSNTGNYNAALTKQTASGASFALRNIIDYTRTNVPIATPTRPFGNRFGSVYDVVNQVEMRQPLLRGRGTAVNRIAGPNAVAGNYNGVLIARIRSDISLTDFEIAVRNLIRDVELNYWELFFAYQDLDTKISARESARGTWDNRKKRLDGEVGRPDEEAQARQQYYLFQNQAQNALTGVANGQLGVLGAERNLRRLMGQLASDGRLIKPISEPSVAPVVFDWHATQAQALELRAEIRRQKWTVKQRELELFAAKSLNQWQFDMIGQYDARGFGDQLFGNPGVVDGSALRGLVNGDLNDWRVGVEFGGAIGNRRGFLAVRNAELSLVRERTLLKEQQRQITHDLNAAYTEVDRAMAALRTNFNSRIAVLEELDPIRARVEIGQDPVFFLLNAEQRAAAAESAIHRAVVDYNLALLNYAFVAGSMLSRFNVSLTEGQWSPEAQQNATRKAGRYPTGGAPRNFDVTPVTAGPVNQVRPLPATSVAQNSVTVEAPVDRDSSDSDEKSKPESNSDTDEDADSRSNSDSVPELDGKSSSTGLNRMIRSSPFSTSDRRNSNSASPARSIFGYR